MGKIREVDAISDAIIETEKEIAGGAWGIEDTEAVDASGDRSLEDIGGGLEGQHDPEDDDETDGEDADGEAESDGEDGEADGEKPPEADAGKGKEKGGEPDRPAARTEPDAGRVPSGKLREANERARTAEAERDTVKAQLTTFSDKLDQAMRRIDDLSRAPRAEPPKVEPAAVKAAPDIFEDPRGFVDHLTGVFESRLSAHGQQLENNRVETSMAIAHAFHKDTFEKAFDALNKLDPRNPDDRVAVQRIYKSPNPGEALVGWHKRNETLARVGDDPNAFEARIREETRQALIKDPEVRKQIIADMRGEAATANNGRPRTETRLPGSLARAGGSNLGAERSDPRASDDSEQSVADAAWR